MKEKSRKMSQKHKETIRNQTLHQKINKRNKYQSNLSVNTILAFPKFAKKDLRNKIMNNDARDLTPKR